ncbi:hypothetical protein Q1695_004942 [Nippostrongylus brasiliensis]|nr:hypothetical protein Q1695_004942 [Nippostrongylus brasiliensis]
MAEQQSSRTQVTAPTSSKAEPEYSPKALEKWMSELPSYLSALPLCQLKIPGSHDSGSTDDLDKSLPVANDQSSLIRNLGISSWVKSGIKRWAVTQRHGIGDQLRAGVRYLDLRISYPPPKVRTSNTDFRVVHALYGISVQKLLAEVIDFLKENPKEVVILDINHLYGFDTQSLTDLRRKIVSMLGKHRMCPFTPIIQNVTLDFMWENRYRVIVIDCEAAETEGNPIWAWSSIESPWPQTSNRKVLLKKLDENIEARSKDEASKSSTFFVSQGVLTPEPQDVLRRWFSSLRKSYSTRANKAVLGWLNDLSEENKEKVNIVLLDFVCAESSGDILSLNAVMGPKAAKGSAETKSAIVESSTNLADPVLA